MLVLSRKIEESVVVGDGCKRLLKVTVLEIRNGAVKLGIEADDVVPVHRAEAWDRITAENWGGTDREIPQSAMAEALLHPLRKHNNLSATAGRHNAKQTQPGKRST
jgi:carbon storage regulator